MGDVCDHVVSSWFSGRQVAACLLWGHEIFIWGRIGKVIQFLAAAMIVVEVIGPERLNRLAQTMDRRISRLSRFMRRSVRWMLKLASTGAGFVVGLGRPSRSRSGRTRIYRLVLYINRRWYRILIAYFLLPMPLVPMAVLLIWMESWNLALAQAIGAIMVLVLYPVILIPFFVVLILMTGLYLQVARTILIMPPLWILSRPNLAVLARNVSLLLLIVGFCLDMLAS